MHILIGWSGGACVSLEWREVNGAIDVSTMRLDLICILTLLRSVGQMSRRLIGIRQLNVRVGGGLLLGGSIVKPNRRFYQAPSAEVYYTYLFSARNTTEKNTLSSDSKPNVNLRHTNTEIRSWTLLIMGYRIHFKSSCSFFRAKLGRKSNKDYWTGMRRRGRRRRRRRMEGGQNRQRARKKTVGVEVSRQPVGETKIEKNTRTQQKKKTQKMMCNIPPSSPVIAW